MTALLLERHSWETSGSSHQIQIPKTAFATFFRKPGKVAVWLWPPRHPARPVKRTVLLSYYGQSDTYRFNWLTEFGKLGRAVIIFEASGNASRPFHVWWFTGADAEKVLRFGYKWQSAKSSQHGSGRHWAIISVPAPR